MITAAERTQEQTGVNEKKEMCVSAVCKCVCLCVYERERERGREEKSHPIIKEYCGTIERSSQNDGDLRQTEASIQFEI